MLMKILDYFFLLRPTLFFSGITIYLLALFPEAAKTPHILSIVIFQAIIYLYNQIFDKETDRINNKLFYLADDIISERNGKILYRFLIILLILFLLLTNIKFSLIILSAVILLNYLYSHPKFNWKGKPYLSAISAFIGGCLGYFSGYFTADQNVNAETIYAAVPSGLAVLTAAVLGMILDYQGDLQSGKETLAVKLGVKKTKYLVILISVCGILVSLLQSELFFLISFSGTLFIQAVFPEKIAWQLKVPILILSLSACWYYPVYFVYIAVYFVVARVYYKRRFNIIYP